LQLLWASVGLTTIMTKLQLLTFFFFQSDRVYLLRRCRWLQVHLITLKTHSHSVGLFRTRDGTVAETSIWPHTTMTGTDSHISIGIRTRNPRKLTATASSRRPCGHRDRL
jgi:hypothetical protein